MSLGCDSAALEKARSEARTEQAEKIAALARRVEALEQEEAACKAELAVAVRLTSAHAEPIFEAGSGTSEIASVVVLAVGAGEFQINGKAMTDEDAKQILIKLASDAPTTAVLIEAAPDVPYGRVMAAMDLARVAGLRRLSHAPPPPPPEPPPIAAPSGPDVGP